MAANETRPQFEIGSDEDWKNRVKAEDAALDQKFRTEQPPGDQAQAESARGAAADQPTAAETFPEASFAGLVGLLATQATVALGLVPNPATRKADKNLPMARYFIDLLGVLQEKTKSSLDQDELLGLEDTLHSLRMAYVQRSKETV